MPLIPPALDDRRFNDLVDELVTRIPAHTPEWTNPRAGDPGRTLIELFAWLGDALLYRANLIPERQRLAFLKLLGVPLQPAVPARGIITLSFDDKERTDALTIQPRARLEKLVTFETRAEVTILPILAQAYYKRPLSSSEESQFAQVVPGLQQIYGITGRARPYVTTPIFPDSMPDANGFDLVRQTIDGSLWLALLTLKEDASAQDLAAVRAAMQKTSTGASQLITVGVAPSLDVPALSEEIGNRAQIPHTWEITTLEENSSKVEYMTLELVPGTDTTAGLTRQGTLRLALPSKNIRAPENDVTKTLRAGVGDLPPRLDDPKLAKRLVAWLRLRPTKTLNSLKLSWVGINAVEIDARQTFAGRLAGQSSGAPEQEFQLPAASVDPNSLQIQVEGGEQGYEFWSRVDDLNSARRDDAVYVLDPEAGTVRFGDGMRGRVPQAGARIRVATMRAGGGSAGNLPPLTLSDISAFDLTGARVSTKLNVQQAIPTRGGEDSETLAEAERRIPALFRHRDRAVTADDYTQLAFATPGVRVGRVQVMPRFKPQQRMENVRGVVSVMVLPFQGEMTPPNPRPDRPFLESVFGYLDARRPLGTELYTNGCEYVPVGISAGIGLREGFDRDAVLLAVRDALRWFLWALPPGGTNGAGWDLGRAVNDREVEVVIARVPGVLSVAGVNLFARLDKQWRIVSRLTPTALAVINLEAWQLPELLTTVLDADGNVPSDLSRAPNPFAVDEVGVPVVPEVC